jgi:sulfite oxidase
MDVNIASARSMSRRHCLGAIAAGVGLAFPSRSWNLFGAEADSPSRCDLLVRSEKPFNAEPRLGRLPESYVTPVEQFFVRNHGNQPKVDPNTFRLTIEGAVDRPVTFTLAELMERFPRVDVTATITCAGNRRIEFAEEKAVPGVAWDAGAIGNAEWSGVRLSDLLKHCGLKAEAKHVWFDGQDQITVPGEVRNFGGSVPLDTVLEGDAAAQVILADRMNGKPLPPEHGFPLRTIVPGYIGARSVKWLSKITVSDKPSSNFYIAKTYKIVKENTPENVAAASPIFEFQTNSAICEAKPLQDQGKYLVRGYALAEGRKGNRIAEISLTLDGGKHWQAAKIVSPVRDFGWVLWSAEIDVPSTTTQIQVKATDSLGNSQPERTTWNAQGYLYNGWHKLMIKKPA